MNEKVDEEYKGIKDVYVLQCICSELEDRIEKYRHLFKTTKIEEKDKEIERLNNIINELEEFKEEHKIMKQILIENNLWETLLNDDRFLEHLRK